MKNILLALSLALFSVTSFATELVEVKVLHGKISLQAPKEFGPMPDNILEIKYPHSRRPTEVLSDETGGVTLAFNHTKNVIAPEQIKEAHSVISKMFHNLYPAATWVRDDVIKQHGQTFMVMEFVSPAIDTKIHNIMYGTSVDGRLLLAAFNTTVEQSEQWLPIGKKIMASITVIK